MSRCYDNERKVGWEDFVPAVAAFVKDAPIEMIAYHAREAAIEFAKISRVIKRRLHVDLQENVSDYRFDVDDDYTVLAVEDVWLEGKLLPKSDGHWPHWGGGYTVFDTGHIELPAMPSEDVPQGLIVEVSVVPGRQSKFFDRRMFDLWSKEIASGTIARLMRMPEAPWYATKEWRAFENEFRRGALSAKTVASRQFTDQPVRMTIRRVV